MHTQRSWPDTATKVGEPIRAALVACVFVAVGTVYFSSMPGEDLSSSYVGCRVVALGLDDHLYSHHPVDFSVVDDPVWVQEASRRGVSARLHPYVQTPLWAWALGPLCTSLDFPPFRTLFVALNLLAMIGVVLLVARRWTANLGTASMVAVVLAALPITHPFHYAMWLAQTHALFVFLTVLALVLARRRPAAAGACLAVAAAVKITPGVLALYWLLVGERRAVAFFTAASAALLALTVLAVGPSLTQAFLGELARTSNVLLLADNNQSVAAWLEGRSAPPEAIYNWHMHALPPATKVLSMAVALVGTAVGAVIDRRPGAGARKAPVGAVLAILAATIAAPIAWSHYYIVLVIPAMLLLDAAITYRTGWPVLPVLGMLALNLAPSFTFRPNFASGVLAIVSLGALTLFPPRATSGGVLSRA